MNRDMLTINRKMEVAGAFNVRDLGGYPTGGGRETAWGRFYRADGLHAVTEAGRQALLDAGVRTIVDLRHAGELAASPNVFAGSDRIAYHHVSLINPASFAAVRVRSLAEMYIGLLDNGYASLRAILEALAGEADGSALFHCTAGKDRTGIVAGLLLDLAGVPPETIADDYAQTAANIAPIMGQLRAGRPIGVPEEAYERFLGCDRDHMLEMLAHLHNRYGGAETYLLEAGLNADRLAILKARLLEA